MLPADLTTADSQPDSRERRAQIDDFMRLLEAARRAADEGVAFSVALLAPAATGLRDEAGGSDRPDEFGESDGDADRPDAPGDGREAQAARSAYDFLRLNLRRADSLAFYGPTLLVALLPRRRPRRAREDLALLLDELEDERPRVRLAFGLASFPEDGAGVEALIERADARLNSALARRAGREESNDVRGMTDSDAAAAAEEFRVRFQFDGADEQTSSTQGRGPEQEFLPLAQSEAGAAGEWRAREVGRQAASEQSQAGRGLPSDFAARRAVRESKRGEEFEAAVLPFAEAAGAAGLLGRAAAEAAARERELRAGGAPLPRRVLLTVSDPARMAQINLLLRSAAYEVRAAFDGGQALDLLRIERADLLVLDYDLKVLDGPAVLRRLHERHRGRLPMPVALLIPAERDTEQLREEARRCGATGFVRLPYDPAELLECVRTTGGKD